MTRTNLSALYKTDFHAWTLTVTELIRQRQFTELNLEDLAEELADLGKKERYELANRLVILLAHLLKWQFQPIQRSSSWRGSINEQRTQIARHLKHNPSLEPYIPEAIIDAYPDAVKLAAADSGLPERIFPTECSYTIVQIIDNQFYPPANAGAP
ncbi:conserved hypothetical protein [Gammaproteobacteria bacterium]